MNQKGYNKFNYSHEWQCAGIEKEQKINNKILEERAVFVCLNCGLKKYVKTKEWYQEG